MTVSNLPSTMWEESGTRPMYSSESEIAAPGGGVAADAVAPDVAAPARAASTSTARLMRAQLTRPGAVRVGSHAPTRDRPQPVPAHRRAPRGRRGQGPQGPARARVLHPAKAAADRQARRTDLVAQAVGRGRAQGRCRQPAA